MTESYIRKKYLSLRQPGSLSGLTLFAKSNSYSKKNAASVLNTLKTYNLHRPVRHKFLRRPIISPFSNFLWQSDTIYYNKFKHHNRNFSYILLCVCTFSKKIWCVPLKRKDGESTKIALESIFKSAKASPEYLWTDKGTEFYSRPVRELLKKYNTTLYSTNSILKAQQAERYIQTVKRHIARYMTFTGKKVWIDQLDNIVKLINSTYNSSIKMAPNDVTKKNESMVFHNLYDKFVRMKKVVPKYKIGQLVKIAKGRVTFRKGYEAAYSEETFVISKIIDLHPVSVYRLADENGQELNANFHEQELIVVGRVQNSDE